MSNVSFEWSNNGLLVKMTNKNIPYQSMSMSWNTYDEVPSEDVLTDKFNSFFNITNNADTPLTNNGENSKSSKIVNRIFKLTDETSIDMGYTNHSEYDEALFRLGKMDIRFPIDKNGKILFKSQPKIKKSDVFGIGGGIADKAAWLNIRKQK